MSIQATPTGVPAAKAARTQPIVSVLQATRASERQAARQKARGQPKTPRIEHSSAKWVIGGTRSDERKWLTKIVEYLHRDPAQETNPRILRFMLKEWPTLQATLHTVASMEKLKLILVANGIPYLRRMHSADPKSTRTQKWEYWNDYSQEGIARFVQDNPTIQPQQVGIRPGVRTTAVTALEENDSEKEDSGDEESTQSAEMEYDTRRLRSPAQTMEDEYDSQALLTAEEMVDTGELQEKLPLETDKTQQFLSHQDRSPSEDQTKMLMQFDVILSQRVEEAVTSLDNRQATWQQQITQLQEQVTRQETLLQERIQAHDHRVLKAETMLTEWEQMLTEQEERLELKEEAFTARLQEQEQ